MKRQRHATSFFIGGRASIGCLLGEGGARSAGFCTSVVLCATNGLALEPGFSRVATCGGGAVGSA